MCADTELKVEGSADWAAVAGVRCIELTPELRNELQICLGNLEMLAEMRLPAEAAQCLARLERAVDGIRRLLALPDAASEARRDGVSGGRCSCDAATM